MLTYLCVSCLLRFGVSCTHADCYRWYPAYFLGTEPCADIYTHTSHAGMGRNFFVAWNCTRPPLPRFTAH
jgi:hypothetical protein